jgi:UDP-galactopyranose mutase
MDNVKFKINVDKKGFLDVEIEGMPEDIVTSMVMAMIDNPDIYEFFNIACKAYEDYKRENLSN